MCHRPTQYKDAIMTCDRKIGPRPTAFQPLTFNSFFFKFRRTQSCTRVLHDAWLGLHNVHWACITPRNINTEKTGVKNDVRKIKFLGFRAHFVTSVNF